MQGYSNAGVVCGEIVGTLGQELVGLGLNDRIFGRSSCASWFSSRNDDHGIVADWCEVDQVWVVWYFEGVRLDKF